ncbi:DUF2842 domain-containing protein [Aurantiacibacter gangjinensis]|uniref:Uncharacterized protein n=1 Tax=Aurantiacibacter gangjinensis TaxID=502682 RepID=A0A0G9MPV8_9SPHN|nr:DUF2842 domain-containing protein [Aurantiacibacter gangjinensis]APE28577.1 hypothetical protein BMF35_a1748 [Aurantiacibacter gangjinensis]KLE32767.1 hypothetical protein AAW01_01630 [Aurantiacibacter gangjinensis]
MREEPTWRIPVGVLGLFVALIIYAVLVAVFVSDIIGSWPVFWQTLVYIVLGVIWIRPLRRFLIWMETGSWREPPKR